MNDTRLPEGDIRDEFRNLGDNLKSVMHTAWESEERKKLQQDIEAGLSELGNVLNQLADDFHTSESDKKIKSEVEDFGERVRSGEVETKVRQELLSALQLVNTELDKAIGKMKSAESASDDDVI